MKKNELVNGKGDPFLRWKIILIMKLQLFIILAFVVQSLAVTTNAQNKKLNLEFRNSTLKEVLATIEEVSDFSVIYKDEQLTSAKTFTASFKDKYVTDILDEFLEKEHLSYQIKGRVIIILPKEESFYQQLMTVSGKVADESGQPLPGVTVAIKGTTHGTITDSNGTYTISNVPLDGILIFSFVGMKSQAIPLDGKTEINVTLSEETIGIEEVIAIGYGVIKKSDLTGSVANIKEEDLISLPAKSAFEAIQGRAAGVVIQSENGVPGGDYKIRIRGATSINASSNPLIVVDGLVGGSMPPPEDIASVEILKDASASAIYGSRGANGVVMVTTKLGKVGRIKVEVNSYLSFQKEIGRLDLLNASEFVDYINEARGSQFFDPNNISIDTDWQDLIFQPGQTQNYQVSVSGGSEKAQYYVSGIYHDQEGVVKTSSLERYSLTSNLKFDLSDFIHLNLNSTIQNSNNNGVITHGGTGPLQSGVITSAQRFDPNQGVTNENGIYTKSKVGIAAFENPMASIDGRDIEKRQENIQLNFKAEIDIAKGLTFNSTFGTIIQNIRFGEYDKKISNVGESANGLATLRYRRNFNFLTEQYLIYNFKLGEKNNFVATGGYSYQKFNNESFTASNSGFITDALGFWNLGAGTSLQIPASSYSGSKIASFYGRFNYNFDNRYLVTLTSRYDGASQFSEENKWSFFPSGALSWNIHNEKFWPENNFITTAKLRSSYGLTGNQAIGPYQSLARISNSFFVLNNSSVSAVRSTSIANKDLTWETTSQLNVGLDIGFFERRLNISSDFYIKKTDDLLFSVPIPAFSGYQTRLENLGATENKGFEIQVDSKNFTGEFEWSTGFNISLNRNKVVELPDGTDIIYSGTPGVTVGSLETSILREGEPVGVFFGYVYDGVYQEGDNFIPGGGFESTPGGEKFADLNGDAVLDSKDRKIIGNPNPKGVLGLNNDFSFKGFYMNIFLQGFLGGDMLNLVKLDLDRLGGNTNATTDALNRWTPENTNTDVPKAYAGRVARISSRFLEDGSFVRLKNISLGYNFKPALLNKLKLSSAKVYISGQNLLTFTKYSGVDPEVAYRSNNINQGLDYDTYPNTVSWTLGVNIGL